MATSSLAAIHASMLAITPHPHTIFMVVSKLATMQMECDETARRKMTCDDYPYNVMAHINDRIPNDRILCITILYNTNIRCYARLG